VRPNEVTFVSGQRGSGKTTWVKHYIQNIDRFLLYDALSEYSGAPRFENIHDFLDYVDANIEHGGFFEAILDTVDNSSFPFFCRAAISMGRVYVVIEELDLFATPYATPVELQKLIKHGRHHSINIIGVSLRPSQVSRLFTSQANRFILFRQVEPRDVAYFKSIVGIQADRLPGLDPYYFLDIDFEKEWTNFQPQKISLEKPFSEKT